MFYKVYRPCRLLRLFLLLSKSKWLPFARDNLFLCRALMAADMAMIIIITSSQRPYRAMPREWEWGPSINHWTNQDINWKEEAKKKCNHSSSSTVRKRCTWGSLGDKSTGQMSRFRMVIRSLWCSLWWGWQCCQFVYWICWLILFSNCWY